MKNVSHLKMELEELEMDLQLLENGEAVAADFEEDIETMYERLDEMIDEVYQLEEAAQEREYSEREYSRGREYSEHGLNYRDFY